MIFSRSYTNILVMFLTVFFLSVQFLKAVSPEDVDDQSSAEKFLKSVSGMVPESSLKGTAFCPQILWMGDDILMPALAFTAQLTDELSAFVSAGVVFMTERAHYASNYGLNYVKPLTKYSGYWNLGVSAVHADHPSWKNRLNSLHAGYVYPFNTFEIGFNLSLNYEKGSVNNAMGTFDVEKFYFSPALLFSIRDWDLKIRLNSETAGFLLSRRLAL